MRGYRENTLIRDSAVISSLEWRVPILRDVRGTNRLELRPFADWSRSWNDGREEIGPRELVSVGLGWSILPESMIGELEPLQVACDPMARTLGCVTNPRRSPSNAATAFLDVVDAFAD